MSIDIVGWEIFRTTNLPVVGATVNVRAASTAQPNSGGIIATQATNASGQYSFTGLADGDYDVDITYSGVTKSYKGLTKSNGIVQASNFASQAANTFLVAPNGSAGRPTFRVMANADIPATITGKTLDACKLLNTLKDANGNTLLGDNAQASAVNFLQLKNAATGNHPALESSGSDANPNIDFRPKGTGVLQWNGATIFTAPTTWTPTLTQGPSGVATLTINEARWFRIYKTVFISCRCQIASIAGTATAGAGNPIIFGGFPVAVRAIVSDKIVGQYSFIDFSASNAAYTGDLVMAASDTSAEGLVDLASNHLGSGFAIGVSDIFSVDLHYEIA